MEIIKSIEDILFKRKIVISGETYQSTINKVVRKILLDIFRNNSKIGIKGAGEHTSNILSLIPEINIEYIFDKEISEKQEKIFNDKVYGILSDKYMTKVDVIIISSFAHRKRMAREVKKIVPSVRIIDLYDILNEKGYCVNEPFYRITCESYESFIYYRNKFNEENSAKALMNLIRSSVDICDFLNFYKYCDIYIDRKFDRYKDVLCAKNEIKNIFENVRDRIQNRSQRDVIMVWNDQVGYNELSKMPYLNECSKHSMFFENAYTMTPFTIPTFREMFQGLKALDDCIYSKPCPKIDVGSSEFIKIVESFGYGFCYVGDDSDGNMFGDEYKITTYAYGSSCVRGLKMLQKIIDSKRPMFIILHAVVETHNPYLSGDLEKAMWYDWPYFQEDIYDNVEVQIDKSLKYWDRQLEFYMRFLSDNCIKIIMSDHGKRFNYQPIYLKNTTHIMLYINGKDVPDIRCSKMFSLYDFPKLVSRILSGNYDESSLLSEMVFLQERAIFNETAIDYYMENNAFESAMAFRAVRTRSELFVILSNGREHYYINGNEEEDVINNEEYSERISYLRQFVDYGFDDDVKNSKMLKKFREVYETHE